MRDAVPAVRLVPVNAPVAVRRFGALKGKLEVTDAFFESLPETLVSDWER